MKQDRRQPRSMVVVYQPSRDGEAALAYALEIAQAAGATLTVTSVAPQGRTDPGCAHCRASAARRNAQLRLAPTNDSRGSPGLSATQRPSVRLHGRGNARRPAHRSRQTDRDRQSRLRGRTPASQVIDPVPITFAVGPHAIGRMRRW